MLKEFKGYKKGVNLGGWLSQCNHTKDRYDNFIKEEDVKRISEWGVDHVRVPVDYNLVEDKEGNYMEEGFAYIQNAIDWCGKYGLNMILDLHKTFGFSFDDGENETGFFDNEKYQERFYLLWEQFAKRYSKYGSRLAFELLNEVTDPAYSDTWNRVIERVIKRIRAIAPTIKILVGGYWNNSVDAVQALEAPYDENIVYNFHSYDPLAFTHQGAYWVKEMPHDFRVPFKVTYAEMQKIVHELFPHMEAGYKIPGDPNGCIDAEYFKLHFANAVRIAEERGAALYCGEYGVIEEASPEDEVEWYKAIHETFEYYGIGRAAWSYKEMNFGLIDKRLDGVREEIIKLL